MGDGNVRCYVSLLSLMFVWDGVGGVGDGNVCLCMDVASRLQAKLVQKLG